MILYFLITFIAVLTIAGFFESPWWFQILDFFRLQYIVFAGATFLVSIFTGNMGLMSFCLIIIALNFFRMRSFLPVWRSIDHHGKKKNIMSINTHEDNENFPKLKQQILKVDPEILLLMECTEDHKNALEEIFEKYEHRLEASVRDGFNICLLSKPELLNDNITYHGPGHTPLLQANVELEGKAYTLFSAHPKPALNKEWSEERNIYYKSIIPIIQNAPYPVIVLGDFNAVPWERQFQNFLSETKLKSTLRGHGYQMTWPVYNPLMGIPMDHILISRSQDYKNFTIGPSIGSDHYPIAIKI